MKRLIALISAMGFLLAVGAVQTAQTTAPNTRQKQTQPKKVIYAKKDPICKMDMDPKKPAAGKSVYKGKTYLFCSKGCKETFDKNPAKYAEK